MLEILGMFKKWLILYFFDILIDHVDSVLMFLSTYLRDREKSDYNSQDPLYTLSQRFDPPAITYDSQQRAVSVLFLVLWSLFHSYSEKKKDD